MRRSRIVQLTILPMLAAAASLAYAQPAPPVYGPPLPPPPANPDAQGLDAPSADDGALAPPGVVEPELAPPGMVPTYDECHDDPSDVRCDPEYYIDDECDGTLDDCGYSTTYIEGGIVRGGFGHYFWIPSGGSGHGG